MLLQSAFKSEDEGGKFGHYVLNVLKNSAQKFN